MPLECCGQFFTSGNRSLVSSIKEVSACREMSTLAQTNASWSANLKVCSQSESPRSRKVACRFMGPSHGGSNCTNPSHFFSSILR